MPFPPYYLPFIGSGTMIGLNAVIHVLISHGIAIGAFFVVMSGEWLIPPLLSEARDRGEWAAYNKRLLRFTVLMVSIAGTTTGAGIWFTTMALSPQGIAHMIRVFFWAWFVEYFDFFFEAAVLILIYFKWDAWQKTGRNLAFRMSLLYSVLAILSGVIITAILGFLLTPDAWLDRSNLFTAFFNPSYPPQLFSRLSFSLVIGSLTGFVFLFIFAKNAPFFTSASKLYGAILLFSAFFFMLSLTWYYTVIPAAFSSQIRFSVLTSYFSQWPWIFTWGNSLLFGVILITAWLGFKRSKKTGRFLFPALLAAVLLVTEFERIREFIRGPYLIPGHMLANGLLVRESGLLMEKGLTSNAPWFQSSWSAGSLSRGAFVYGTNCTVCHTAGGINDIRERVRGRSEDGLFVILKHTQDLVPFMPPLYGDDGERRDVANFLYKLGNGKVRFRSLSRNLVRESDASGS